jgi:hypothetical protein
MLSSFDNLKITCPLLAEGFGVSSFGGLCRHTYDNQLIGTIPTELGKMAVMKKL